MFVNIHIFQPRSIPFQRSGHVPYFRVICIRKGATDHNLTSRSSVLEMS